MSSSRIKAEPQLFWMTNLRRSRWPSHAIAAPWASTGPKSWKAFIKGSLHLGCWGIVMVIPAAFAAAWSPSTRHLVPWDRARMTWNCGVCVSGL